MHSTTVLPYDCTCDDDDGGYYALCACDWVGPWRPTWVRAQIDRLAHLNGQLV